MGHIGEQPQSTLLQTDRRRTKTARVGTRTLVANNERNRIRFVASMRFMPQVRAWFSRFFGLFSKSRRNAEMADEIAQHIDLLTQRNIAAGMSASDARNAAHREFGGVEQIKEVAREQRIWRWGDDIVQDIRFGVRILRRSPGFSI